MPGDVDDLRILFHQGFQILACANSVVAVPFVCYISGIRNTMMGQHKDGCGGVICGSFCKAGL